MEINLIDIKKAFIIQFNSEVKTSDGTSRYHANELPIPIVGILKGDYFLDINTLNLYPIAYLGIDNILTDVPIMNVQYAYFIESFIPNNLSEKEDILKKAIDAHKYYENMKEIEEEGKIICFQKRKFERLKRAAKYNNC